MPVIGCGCGWVGFECWGTWWCGWVASRRLELLDECREGFSEPCELRRAAMRVPDCCWPALYEERLSDVRWPEVVGEAGSVVLFPDENALRGNSSLREWVSLPLPVSDFDRGVGVRTMASPSGRRRIGAGDCPSGTRLPPSVCSGLSARSRLIRRASEDVKKSENWRFSVAPLSSSLFARRDCFHLREPLLPLLSFPLLCLLGPTLSR